MKTPAIFVQLAMYVVVMLTEILVPCLFGNEITLECRKTTTAVYETNWLQMSVGDRKLLISFMEHLKRPAKFMAQSFYDVNLQTLMKVSH